MSPNSTRSLRVPEFVLRKYICAVCRRACTHEERASGGVIRDVTNRRSASREGGEATNKRGGEGGVKSK